MRGSRLIALGCALGLASVAYLTLDARGSWGFVLGFRGPRLAGLALVGAATGAATVLFQTVSANRILTPSIMGFDALYLLIQAGLVFGLGGLGFAMLDARVKFAAETALMMLAAATLFALLLGRGREDMQRMLLAGVICGALFRSLAEFLQRLMDPNAFAVLQGASFASFGRIDGTLLAVGGALSGLALGVAWGMRRALDVVALGRAPAIGLGVGHDALVRGTLMLVALLVSVATALVGPVAFLGLLVASLAHLVVRSPRHALLLPAAGLIGALLLVAGQTVFERVLGLEGALSMVIEFAGGLLFLALLLRGRRG